MINLNIVYLKIIQEQKIENSLMNKFLKTYDLYFLIVTNPDGYEFSLSVRNRIRLF
jgi:hypothetical protein